MAAGDVENEALITFKLMWQGCKTALPLQVFDQARCLMMTSWLRGLIVN